MSLKNDYQMSLRFDMIIKVMKNYYLSSKTRHDN